MPFLWIFEATFFTWAVDTSRDAVESPVENRDTDDISLCTALGDEPEVADNVGLIDKAVRVDPSGRDRPR